jgi:hypothetical protein
LAENECRWDRPDEAVAAALEARLRDDQERVDQAVQVLIRCKHMRIFIVCFCIKKRKEDREYNQKIQNEKALAQEQSQVICIVHCAVLCDIHFQSKIQRIMNEWLKPPRAVRQRNIVELLNTADTVIPFVATAGEELIAALRSLNIKSSSAEEVLKMIFDILYASILFQIRKGYMKTARIIHPDKISG